MIETVSELQMLLENERVFHDRVSRRVHQLRTDWAIGIVLDENHYRRIRSAVYSEAGAYLRKEHRFNLPSKHQAITSKLTDYFIRRYAEEHPTFINALRAATPDWVRGQCAMPWDDFESLVDNAKFWAEHTKPELPLIENMAAYITAKSQSTPEKEPDMNPIPHASTPIFTAPTIETKTFIHGQDAAHMSDDEIFNAIAGIEAEITKLDKIENKPKKLEAKIAQMRDDIGKLKDYVDARS